MAATPFRVTLVVSNGNNSKAFHLLGSDVNAQYLTLTDGTDTIYAPSDAYLITDILCSRTATDTTTWTLYANGETQPYVIAPNANQQDQGLGQVQRAPIRFPKGAKLRIMQNT